MSDSSDAESLVRQEQQAKFVTLFTAMPRGHLPSYLQALEDSAHHRLFLLRTNDVLCRNDTDSHTHDIETDLHMHNAIGNGFVTILWTDPAGPVAFEAEVLIAYPLTLTLLGIDAYAYLDRLLRQH